MNLYVSNLGPNVKDEDLKQLFSAYGNVISAKVIIDKFSNQSRGFGFVEMPDNTEAQNAMSALDGTSNDNRFIKITEARPRENRPRTNKW